MRIQMSLVIAGIFLSMIGCAKRDPGPPPGSPDSRADCPHLAAPATGASGMMGGGMMGGGMMGGGMMGGGGMSTSDGGAMMNCGMMGGSAMSTSDGGAMMNCGMMGGGSMPHGPMGSRAGAVAAHSLSSEGTSALLHALDDEYRAEELYTSIGASKLGTRAPFLPAMRSERNHAWILEGLAVAHGVDLSARPRATAKEPEVTSVPAGCRVASESEKRTIALYDDLLKTDIPSDVRTAFEHLRSASAERYLPMFQSCR